MRSRKKSAISRTTIAIVVIIIAIIIIGVAVYLLQQPRPTTPAPTTTSPTATQTQATGTATQQTKTIYIGALLPISGELASIGIEAREVLTYAQNQANALLQQLGSNIRIEVVIKDTQTNPQMALSDIQTLYSQGVRLVIGPFSSGELRNIMSFVINNNMIVFSPSSTSPALATPDRKGYVWRDVPNDTYQGVVIANIMYNQGIKAIAVIWRGDTYGDGLVNVTTKTFTALGGVVKLVARYAPETKDFSSYVAALASTVSQLISQYGADKVAVYDVSFEEAAGILQLASQYPQLTQVKWYGSDGTAGVGSIVQNPVAAQVAYTTTFLNPIAAPVHTVYYDNLTNYFKRTLQAYSYITYDIFWIYVYSILKVGSDNPDQIRLVLPKVAAKFYGASGYHEFDEYGDRLTGAYQLQIVNKTSTGYTWAIYGVYDIQSMNLTPGFPPPSPTPQGYLVPADPQALSKLASIS